MGIGLGPGLGPMLALASKSACNFTSLLVLGKKLSALLLRKLLVLKESDRFSFWSCNAMTGQPLLRPVPRLLRQVQPALPCTDPWISEPGRFCQAPVWVVRGQRLAEMGLSGSPWAPNANEQKEAPSAPICRLLALASLGPTMCCLKSQDTGLLTSVF